MSQILITDEFLFQQSGEESPLLPLDLESDYYQSLLEFTKTQFEEAWQDELDRLSGSRDLGLFGPGPEYAEDYNDSESDSGISSPGNRHQELSMEDELKDTFFDYEKPSNGFTAIEDPFLSNLDIDMPGIEIEDLANAEDFETYFLQQLGGEDGKGKMENQVGSILDFDFPTDPQLLNKLFDLQNEAETVDASLSGNEEASIALDIKQTPDGEVGTVTTLDNGGRSRRKSKLNSNAGSGCDDAITFIETNVPAEVKQTKVNKSRKQKIGTANKVSKGRIEKNKKKVQQRDQTPKMHMLDPEIYPEAKNAVAAHRRRVHANNVRKQLEKELAEARKIIADQNLELDWLRQQVNPQRLGFQAR